MADLHIAGTPCVDFSLRGDRGAEEGPTMSVFGAWIAQRIQLQETYILQENVPQFQPSLIADFINDVYDIDSTIIDAQALGWPIARTRRYTLCRHKVKSLPFRSPMSIFTCMFHKAAQIAENHDHQEPPWSCFFIGTQDELSEECDWARARPSVQADNHDPRMGIFWHCLSTREQEVLDIYKREYPGVAYSLNQSPSFSSTHSTFGCLHTLIRNLGLIWFFGPNELLCFMFVRLLDFSDIDY